ncbi:hypothetical protein SNE40_017686 [Patella caerulea]|uniref:RWD domain-containing protein n=1 Tax=Patella caerulea TaxID=87958 RepID=A0AAN8PMC4_PATCE
MLFEDNLTKQVEEIEALSAIYGDDLTVVDVTKRKYEIKITNGDETSKRKICLEVTLPEDYPKTSPPQYQIHAMWLSDDERRDIENSLADIFIENIGDSILFMWIEKIREFLQTSTNNTASVGASSINLETEESNGAQNDTPHNNEDETVQDNTDSSLAKEVDNLEIEYEYTKYKAEDKTKVEEELKCPEILHGEFIHDRKSFFQAHCAPVNSVKEVDLVMDKLLENRKIAAATHNMQAYRICQEGKKNDLWYQDCKDDGEIHAGNRMLHLMEILEVRNVLVVVTRWYGGIHLGPDRFKHINNCTRDILDLGGYIKNKAEKKGPKSGKKSKKDS